MFVLNSVSFFIIILCYRLCLGCSVVLIVVFVMFLFFGCLLIVVGVNVCDFVLLKVCCVLKVDVGFFFSGFVKLICGFNGLFIVVYFLLKILV